MRFDGDRLATFTTSFNANGVSDFRVVGTEGNIHAEPAYEYAEALGYTLTVGETVKKKKGRRRDQFAAEIAYFSDCVMKGKDPEPSAEEGCWDVRVVNALYQSAQTGKPVKLQSLRTAKSARRKQQGEDFPPVRRSRSSSRSRNRTTRRSNADRYGKRLTGRRPRLARADVRDLRVDQRARRLLGRPAATSSPPSSSTLPSALSDTTSRTVVVSPLGALSAPSLTSDFPSHFVVIVTAPPCPAGVEVSRPGL